MVDNASQIGPQWIVGKLRGVTAGARRPKCWCAVIDRLKDLGARSVRPLEGVEENVTFRPAD